MKHPALSADGRRLAFSFHGDLWVCPSEGGRAERLTDHEGDEWKPAWSPDGSSIAFAADWRGNRDLYVLDLRNRLSRPLTFHSEDDDKPAWSPDGKWIAFHSNRDGNVDLPLNNDVHDVWKIPSSGGTAVRITRFRGDNPSWSPDGSEIVYDRYAGGYGDGEHDLWIVAADGDSVPRPLVASPEDSRNPVLAGNVLYFSHEAHGIRLVRQRNLWRMTPAAGPPFQVTGFSTDHVMWPTASSNGDRIVFEHDFDFYSLDPRVSPPVPRKLSLRIDPSAYPQTPKTKTLRSGAEDPAWSPDGTRIACILEGDLWTMKVDGTEPRRLTDSREDERQPSWSADGRTLIFVRSLWGGPGHVCTISSEGGPVRNMTREPGRYSRPVLSPEGTKLICSSVERSETDLLLIVPASGNLRTLAGRTSVAESDPSFSPDGTVIAYLATSSLGSSHRTDIVLQPLDGSKATVYSHGDSWKAALAWSPDGRTLACVSGSPPSVHVMNAVTGESEAISNLRGAPPDTLSWSPDSTMLLLASVRSRSRGAEPSMLRVLDALGKAEPATVEFLAEKQVLLTEEMSALFREVWGLYNDHYYDPFFHGADWAALREKYSPIAAECRTRPEIHELINDLISELRSSHVHLIPAEIRNESITGALGADLLPQEDGSLRIARLVENGPCDRAGIREGDRIVAVGETDLKPEIDLDRLLTRPASDGLKEIALAVRDGAGDIRTFHLTPLSCTALRNLKYQNQIAARKSRVRGKSGGRLAYAHIRMMAAPEVARIRREIEAEFPHAEGLILDIRDGVGGMAHREIVAWLDPSAPARLNRNPVSFIRYRNGTGAPDRFPERVRGKAWDKPVILVQNEISRSDKEILPYTFRSAGIGWIVGMTTAGGVIGGNFRRVRDGSSIMLSTQGWFSADGRNQEALGIAPDFRIPETQADLHAGHDAQLEKAIEILTAQMEGRLSPPKTTPPLEPAEEKK